MRGQSGVVFLTTTTLDEAFSEFKIGRSHIAFIRKPPSPSDKDANSFVGLVTINDVLEHIVQSKILGESHEEHVALSIVPTSAPVTVIATSSSDTERTPLLPK